MASVQRRTSSTGKTYYQAVWFVSLPDGARKQKTKSFDRKKDADVFIRDAIGFEQKGIIDPKKFTVSTYLDFWIRSREEAGEAAVATLQGNRYAIGLIKAQIGNVALVKLQRAQVEAAYRGIRKGGGKSKKKATKGEPQQLSAQTVRHVHRMFTQALGQGVIWRYISENVAHGIKTGKVMDPAPRLPSNDQAAKVIAAVDTPEGMEIYAYLPLAVRLMIITGVRRGELLGLSLESIDVEARTVTVRDTVIETKQGPVLRQAITKTNGSQRTIVLPAEIMPMLARHKAALAAQRLAYGRGWFDGPALLFPDMDGSPLNPNWFTACMGRLMRLAKVEGIPACHSWRHFMATELLSSGMDVKQVSSRLGHTTPIITLKNYAHATKERDEKAANIMATKLQSFTTISQQDGAKR